MNSLAVVHNNAMSVNEIMTMAQTFAESGMFADTKQAAQAFVKIQAGQEIGIPPFQAMSGIHIIQGRTAIGAGVIASTVKGSGKYDYKVVKHDETVCSIDFYQGKERIGNSTFTIDDAKKAATKNLDKFPKNMLFARAISNGVKWFAPDVFAGPVYTMEELNSEPVTEDVSYEEVQSLPDLNPSHKSWKGVIKKLKDGQTIDIVKQHFSITPENEQLLNDAAAEVA